MPRVAVENNSRVALRICPVDKARLMRASALEHTDLTDFILRNVLRVHCQPNMTRPAWYEEAIAKKHGRPG